MGETGRRQEIWEDVWIPSTCGGCYGACAIKVHRVNGVVVGVEGFPESKHGPEGGLCGKGMASIQILYDFNRRNVPLRRTNPKKGLYEEGDWQEISWDQALDEIAERLKKVLAEDPRKLVVAASPSPNPAGTVVMQAFGALLGTPNFFFGGAGLHCGSGAHMAAGATHSSWSHCPDWKYGNYIVFFGAGKGFGSGHGAGIMIRQAAEARARGCKTVVFDPICNFSGGKATEWIPLIPGTDGAIALAMTNVILNELNIFDATYIKTKTNGPYLIRPDMRYLRDSETQKPLVWDIEEEKAKTYDDPTIKDYAILGKYTIDGTECQPSFQLIRDHVKKYTPEMASEISTVPAKTIRRIATEFANAAQVGSTIVIDGKELPYRPVSAVIFRGGQGHSNSLHTCVAVDRLNQLLGAADVPGGCLGWPPNVMGYPGTGRPVIGPSAGPDGLLVAGQFAFHMPWPLEEPKLPCEMLSLQDLFRLATFSPYPPGEGREELWQKVGINYRPEMMLSIAGNLPLAVANRDTMADFLLQIPFIVSTDIYPTEFAEGFADIVLPDTCYLETLTIIENVPTFFFSHAPGMDDWHCHIRQPVIPPQYERRYYLDVLTDLADRIGARPQLNTFFNLMARYDEEHQIKIDEKVSWNDVMDRWLKYWFGAEHNLEWFKKNGFISWKKRVEEAYFRPFIDTRVPIYLEYMVDQGEKTKELAEGVGIHLNWDQYTPLVDWFPCPPHEADPRYDLYCFSYRDILHTGSSNIGNPLIDEVSHMNPYTYNIVIHTDTASRKGLKDGDIIQIESYNGQKVEGPIKTMEGCHPQVIAIAGTAGKWSKGQPIAFGKGVNFDTLLFLDLEHADPTSLNLEISAKVSICKKEGK